MSVEQKENSLFKQQSLKYVWGNYHDEIVQEDSKPEKWKGYNEATEQHANSSVEWGFSGHFFYVALTLRIC